MIRTAFFLLVLFTIITGIIYPLIVTGFAQLAYPHKANGSLIKRDDKIVGSLLIGQAFTAPQYFWGRPSATKPFPYNAENSSGSNMGPSNPTFLAEVKKRIATNQKIPIDVVTASGSGLDPEISPEAAYYQVARIAKARGVSEKSIQSLIQNFIKKRTLGILGEPRVNVLQLNLALDQEDRR